MATKATAATPVPTMTVRLNTSRVGQAASGATYIQNVKDVVSVPVDEGRRMIEAGQASTVTEQEKD